MSNEREDMLLVLQRQLNELYTNLQHRDALVASLQAEVRTLQIPQRQINDLHTALRLETERGALLSAAVTDLETEMETVTQQLRKLSRAVAKPASIRAVDPVRSRSRIRPRADEASPELQ